MSWTTLRPGAGRLGVQAELAEEPFDDLDMVLRLGQVLPPLLAQAVIGHALEGGLVDLGPGDLRLQRLQEKFVDLSVFHRSCFLSVSRPRPGVGPFSLLLKQSGPNGAVAQRGRVRELAPSLVAAGEADDEVDRRG